MHRHADDDSDKTPTPNPNFSEEEENQARISTRWFGYIAVGITMVSLIGGLALVVCVAYWFFRSR